ncbi:MAG: sigma-70 family RNA polymerase sigma factor [candidate division Zixibacteria bacterium]|nr:sigma-70 family RNA polymerase sigma factor [candidate division Zixibacteria bacterium]
MKKISKKSLADLIEKCNNGDEAAWHILIDFIAPYVFAICSKSRMTRDESFDIFGQVSLQLIKSIKRLKEPGSLLAFVGTITRREIYAFFQKIMMTDSIDEEIVNSVPDLYSKSPEDDFVLLEKREMLMEAMLSLSERDFLLIKMLYFDPGEPSYKAIAKKLNMPVSSIGPIRGKILVRLYKYLKIKNKGK